MKILVVAWMNSGSTDMPLFHVNQWRAMGHEVEVIPFDLEVTDEPWFRLWNSLEGCELEIGELRIANACRRFKPDLLLLFYHFMRAGRMQRIRQECGCKIGFYLDNNNLLWRDTAQVLLLADFIAIHDRYVEPLVSGDRHAIRNPNAYYVRGAAEPSEHRPVQLTEWERNRYGCDVAFIGSAGPDRLAAMSLLTSHRLKIWGYPKGWAALPELQPSVSAEPVYGLKKTKIYNAAALVLNIEEGVRQLNAINPRICEALACGGFVLTKYTADLEEVGFRDGESLAWFHNIDEMQEKASYYLARPEERLRISKLGSDLVLRELTYEKISREWMNWMENQCVSGEGAVQRARI